MVTSRSVDELLQAGRDAFGRSAWNDAFEALSAADLEGSLTAEDLDALGRAAWCVGRVDESIRAHERAYAAYVDAGDKRRAAFLAMWWLEGSYSNKGMASVAEGWVGRAARLLEGEPASAEHGWLAHVQGDTERALALARRFGDRDLEAFALHRRGRDLVAEGRVAEGMAIIDEICASIAAREIQPDDASLMYCMTIGVCDGLADYRRAHEWWEVAHKYFQGFGPNIFPSMCRFHEASLMHVRGSWDEAEQRSLASIDEMRTFDAEIGGLSFRELGDLRRKRGDLAGADEAYRQAHEAGVDPQPGLALLRLAQGKTESAMTLIRGTLEAEDNAKRLDRARALLPAFVTIAIASGNQEAARSAAEELESSAAGYGTAALLATAARARGSVELADREVGEAVKTFRRALQLWRDVDAPYEAACTRLLLGEAYVAKGDVDSAKLELQAARSTFERLGARPDARRAEVLLERTATSETSQPARRTFMFTDIVGSTALIEVIGDDAWRDLRSWHDESLRACFLEHGGEEMDDAGDGFFIAFPDARSAIECAVGIQRKLADHRRAQGFSPMIRIGLHAAEATQSGGKYAGRGVHAAARIGAHAGGDEILASASTVAGLEDLIASEPRNVMLKGMSEAVAVVSIDWR